MMQPTARLRWAFLDCLGLPLDGWPAAQVNRNGEPHYYILEQWWEPLSPAREPGEWRPVPFTVEEP